MFLCLYESRRIVGGLQEITGKELRERKRERKREIRKIFAGFSQCEILCQKRRVWRNTRIYASILVRYTCSTYSVSDARIYRFDGSTRAERVIRGTKEDVVECCVSNSRLFADELAFVRGIAYSKNIIRDVYHRVRKKKTKKKRLNLCIRLLLAMSLMVVANICIYTIKFKRYSICVLIQVF